MEVGPVTVLGTRPGAVAVDPAEPVGPVPRRVRPPRWLDLRLLLGVLLVLGSVLLGARVVAGADRTVPVWSASGDLAAGTVLTTQDLVPVDVRLAGAAGAYLSTTTQPQGRTLSRAVRKGELLPRSALDGAPAQVQLALPVQAGYVPPGLGRGARVDVYALPATAPAAAAATAAGPDVVVVVRDAPVQAVSGRSQGVLSAPTATVQVVVSVPSGQAPDVLAAVGGRSLAVVLHEGVADESTGPTG
jgi:hypothetical protein